MAEPTVRFQRSLTVMGTFGFLVLVTGCLYAARTILVPLALAVLLTFLLTPAATFLQRYGLGRVFSVLLVVTTACTLLGGLGWLVTSQVTGLAAELPSHEDNIKRKLSVLQSFGQSEAFAEVSRSLRTIADQLKKQSPAPTEEQTNALPPVPVVMQDRVFPPGFGQLGGVLWSALGPLADLALVVVLVAFMLMNREDLRNRVLRLIGHGNLTLTTKALDDAGQRISRYLTMQLLVNSGFGAAVGLGLFLLGVPYALLWGMMAAVLRYIPYLGAWLAALLPIAISFFTSEGWFQPVVVAVLFVVLEPPISLILEPMLYGRTVGVSESALLVAVAFWAWVWGPIGMLLSTPLTVCLIVLGKYVRQLGFLDVLLGDEPALGRDLRYYQRLLVRDQDEAADVAEEHMKASSLESTYDEVLIPALTFARRDLEHDNLSAEDAQFIIQGTHEIADELELRAQRPQELSKQSESDKQVVLACPARDEADEVALQMFRQLVEADGAEIEIAPAAVLASEMIERVEKVKPCVLCIGSLPPGGLAHARYLCLKLKARFPNLKIAVGRWGLKTNVDRNRDQLTAAGADVFATTLKESHAQLVELLQMTRFCKPDTEEGNATEETREKVLAAANSHA